MIRYFYVSSFWVACYNLGYYNQRIQNINYLTNTALIGGR